MSGPDDVDVVCAVVPLEEQADTPTASAKASSAHVATRAARPRRRIRWTRVITDLPGKT
jgi:hypothetical protein